MTTLELGQIVDAVMIGSFAYAAALQHYGTNGQRMEQGFVLLQLYNDPIAIAAAVHDLAVLIGEHDCEEGPWTL